MNDRIGLQVALPSIGYHRANNIDTDIELYLGSNGKEKLALIVIDNRGDIVSSVHGIKRVIELAKESRAIAGADFNFLVIVKDICKNNKFTNAENVLFFNEYDYSIKGNNYSPVFKDDVRKLKEVIGNIKKEKLFNDNRLGIVSAFKEHHVIVTPILIVLLILIYMFFNDKNDVYGISKELLSEGEYYRTITYAFMHASLLHLAANMISLGIIGFTLERQIGALPFLSVYLVSAVIGAYVSTIYSSDPAIITVGASGSICGLIAANIVSVMFLPKDRHGNAIIASVIWLLIIFAYGTMGNVDNACHIGGAIGGVITMLLFDFAVGIVFSSNVIEANNYHFMRLNERKTIMNRMDGSRDYSSPCFILEGKK